MERNKRHTQRGYFGFCYDLFRNYCRRTVSTRDCRPYSRSRREHRHRRGYPTAIHHYLAVCLLSVTPAFAAEDPTVQNSSNPVAAATGNVTNQAVQFQNNGAPSRQYFANNVSCNGATMQLSPFYMGNDTIPQESTGYVRNNNFGMQLNFSVPLDGSMIELCKSIAKKHEQKLRLDYELVRALKCTEIMKAGFMFRPGSRVEVLCHDVIPIVANDKKESDGGSVQ
jgi:hypothetical protein